EPYYSPRFTSSRRDVEIVESYEWELHRMTLPDGQYGVICYYFDSTKLHDAEDKLRRSEESLRLAQEAGNVGIWDWDLITGIVRWTPELEKMYGLEPGNVSNYGDFRALVHPGDIARVEAEQAKAVAEHEHFEFEFRFRRPGGETGWVYCRGGAMYNEDGRPVRQFGVNIDITPRKNVEVALRESEERFRELAEKAGSIILRFDPAGRITYFNEFAEQFFGFPRNEILGKPVVGTIVPATDSSGKDLDLMVRDIVANPVRYANNENENVRKNGERVWVRWTNKPVFNLDGTIREFTTIGSDITERKQVEEALKRSHAEQEVLLSEIHHRVKNNLTAFISLLSLEGSTEETPEGRELKKELQNRARSMALIHETLYRTHQFSGIDMEQYLIPLVDQVVKSYGSPKFIKTVVDAKGVTLDLGRATPTGLIVNELVTNSLKHAFPNDRIACRTGQEDPCTISVRLTKEDGTYSLTVSDNGVGMPVGFDPMTAKSLGLKLVIFLAKHQMHANVGINSGKETEFVFRFRERNLGT
ncbi:MAG: PAS domain S-box protein, partial [Methanoregulaceae archaeon]|nr:PAS domain S-box protein [Methanoregulaceae archaeon]